jgi:hypothetical protein
MFQRLALALSAAAALVVTGAATAANGAAPDKPSSSISPPIVVSSSSFTALATGGPHYGDTVTFDVTTTATSYPFVNLTCYQNGGLVAQGSAGFFAGALGNGTFGLYSPKWTGGAADCTAYLDMYSHGKWKHLASTSFHVDA